MKKLLIVCLLIVFCSLTVSAQTSDAEADAMLNLLGVHKREIISKLVEVSKKDSVAFWKIYDEYQAANKITFACTKRQRWPMAT